MDTNIQATADLTPPAAGEYWPGQGGYFICTLPALLGLPARHVVAAKEEAEDLSFGPYQDMAGATSQIDGTANTKALLAAGDHPAARWAADYTADGHHDFHLPARLDLLMAYICAPALFSKADWYWSSTQVSRGYSFAQSFDGGDSGWLDEGHELLVRPFRVIPLDA